MNLNKIPVFSYKKDIRLIPLYDIHVGAESFDEKAFLNTIDYIKRNDNVYWSLDGDCLENVTANCVADPYSQVMLPHDQEAYLLDKLRPIKHRATYSIDGNHTNRTRKRAYYNIMLSLSRELNLTYVGIGGYIIYQCGKERYTIATQHGSSGGSNWETEIKRLRTVYSSAELFILGHDHNLIFEMKPYVSIDKNGREIHKVVYFSRAGNYLGRAEYAKEKLYELKLTGSVNMKFHSKFHAITGYRMQYLNGEPIYENFNNAGRKIK